MTRSEVIEFMVFLKTDAELRGQFRRELSAIMREEIAPTVVYRQPNAREVVCQVPPGMWTYEKATAMTGCNLNYINVGIYRQYFGGGHGLVVKEDLIMWIMGKGRAKTRKTLMDNLEREEAQQKAAQRSLPKHPQQHEECALQLF